MIAAAATSKRPLLRKEGMPSMIAGRAEGACLSQTVSTNPKIQRTSVAGKRRVSRGYFAAREIPVGEAS